MLHREVQKGVDVLFSFDRFDSKGQIIPTSGTYDLKDNAGTSVQSGSLTISSDGSMSFTLLTAVNTKTGFNFKIELLYVVNTVDTRENILFDVVETPLINIVTDKDLFNYVPILRDKIFEKRGRCSSNGTTTTIVATSLRADNRDWTGARGRIVQLGITKEFRVSSFVRTTSTITFDPPITATVSGDYFNLRQSFEEVIEDSYTRVRQDIRNKIGCTSGYIDSNVLKNLTIFDALTTICRSNVELADDKWSLWKVDFELMFKNELVKINEPYDKSGEGNISDKENDERPNTSIIEIKR